MSDQQQNVDVVETENATEAEAPVETPAEGEAQDEATHGEPQGESGADDLEARLVAAEQARDEYLDALQRERAAFDNFRKRATKERMDALDRGAEQVCANLLGVLDNLGYALAAAEGEERVAKGVQMVSEQLMAVLAEAGLEVVPGVGAPFDPQIHEALQQVEASEASEAGETRSDEPVVVEVFRTGYRFKGRTLRPASVKVAK